MLIGIDGNEANEVRADIGAPAGVNVYAIELLTAIYKLQDEWKKDHEVVVYLKHPPSPLLPKATKSYRYKVLSGGGLWILTRLTPYLVGEWLVDKAPKVFFSPSHYSPLMTPMPKAVSIMDLGYLDNSTTLKAKDYWQLKYWTAMSLRMATRVFAISKSTKNEIVRHYQGQGGKVVVTHLAYDSTFFNEDTKSHEASRIKALKHRFSIGQKYILYLGVIKPSKNIGALVTAWSQIEHKYPKYSLVIGGKKSWGYNEVLHKVVEVGLENKIIFTDFIPERDKPALVSGAYLFVLPSLTEGFGLDILNAMGCGVPVVASSRGSIPEVVGDTELLFDPEDVDDIADKIEKVLKMNKVDYNKLVKKSLNHAEKFSWEKTARKTIKVLTSIKK